MKMIQKIIVLTLLSFTSLYSADAVVGVWQMDMPKMQETNPVEKMEMSKQVVVSMFAGAWAEVKFASDGTFDLSKAKQSGIWRKVGDTYIIQASKKAPENKLTILDDKHMNIVFNDPNIGVLRFYFQKSVK